MRSKHGALQKSKFLVKDVSRNGDVPVRLTIFGVPMRLSKLIPPRWASYSVKTFLLGFRFCVSQTVSARVSAGPYRSTHTTSANLTTFMGVRNAVACARFINVAHDSMRSLVLVLKSANTKRTFGPLMITFQNNLATATALAFLETGTVE